MVKQLLHRFRNVNSILLDGGIDANVEITADRVIGTSKEGNVLFDVSQNLYDALTEKAYIIEPTNPWE